MDHRVGNHYNVKCPHCGKVNNYVCQEIKMELNKVKYFNKPCFHCKKIVYYHAQYEIQVVAFTEDPKAHAEKISPKIK